MNVMFLSLDPKKAAICSVNSHIIKLPVEVMQMIEFAYGMNKSDRHYNHPMSQWIRSSVANFSWAVDYGIELCKEYYHRYGYKKNRQHACLSFFKKCNYIPENIPALGIQITDPPRCFGEYKGIIPETDNVVVDYRNYYLAAKSHLFKWTNREKPSFIIDD